MYCHSMKWVVINETAFLHALSSSQSCHGIPEDLHRSVGQCLLVPYCPGMKKFGVKMLGSYLNLGQVEGVKHIIVTDLDTEP